MEFKVESVENQTEVIQFLDDRIFEYNSSATGKFEGTQFTLIVRDETDHIIGGITGWRWAGMGEIVLFWIKEEYRNKGIGKKLLQAAEDEIIKHGGTTILIRSYSFQSPWFYEKNGYKTVFIMDDFPDCHKQYTLIKKISLVIESLVVS